MTVNRSFPALLLIFACLPGAHAGRYYTGRVAPKSVPVPVGIAGVVAGPAAYKLDAPKLAPAGGSLALPVLPALATPKLNAPLNAVSREAAVSIPRSTVFPKDAPARLNGADSSERIAPRSDSRRADLEPVSVEAQTERPLFAPRSENANREVRAARNASDQLQEAGRFSDAKRASLQLDAFARIFDGNVDREPTPVQTDEARDAIAAKTSRKTEYLKEAEGLRGEVLLDKLHDISGRGFHSHSYDSAQDALFSEIDNFKYRGHRGVMAAYSQVFVPGRSTEGKDYKGKGDANGDGHVDREGMNVEHLWPQSYFGKRAPMRSDMHHLMATFVHPNGERSRYPFGEVPDNQAIYRNRAGAKLGNDVFEPPDAVKGRVARGMLYFYMRYRNRGILPGSRARNFWNSRIDMFLRWNEQFPPSVFELRRNDLVEKWQGNRNPFVDDPGLARRIGIENLRLPEGRGGSHAGRERRSETEREIREHLGSGGDVAVVRAPKQKGKKRKKKRGHRKKRRKHGR
jgi:hypothetical protein